MSFTEAQIEAAALALINKARADDEDVVLAPLSSLSEVYWSYADWARETARAALEAAERAAWQPFSTAPEDGTVVLVFRQDAGAFSAHYVETDSHLASSMNPPEGDCYWFSTGGDDLTGDLPTHFRPLPAPPEGTPA